VTMVTGAYIRWLTLHKSRTHVLCCVEGRVYEVKPKEKGYTQGLQLDVMVDLLIVEPDYLPDSEILAFSCVYTP
jgi:hypothetical protein